MPRGNVKQPYGGISTGGGGQFAAGFERAKAGRMAGNKKGLTIGSKPEGAKPKASLPDTKSIKLGKAVPAQKAPALFAGARTVAKAAAKPSLAGVAVRLAKGVTKGPVGAAVAIGSAVFALGKIAGSNPNPNPPGRGRKPPSADTTRKVGLQHFHDSMAREEASRKRKK